MTRNGFAVLVLAGCSFLLGRIFGLLELHVLGIGLVLLVGMALVLVHARPVAIQVERTPDPAHPEVGDASRILLRLTADRRSPLLELWEPVGDLTGAAMRLAPMPRQTSARASYWLPTTRRGLVQVGPMSAEVVDPFGLASRRRWIAPAEDVLVRPRMVPLMLPALGTSGGPLARRLAERALGSTSADEFRSLRTYVEGDDLRRVHWAATARRGELLVRETDPGSNLDTVVILDLDEASYVGPSRHTDPTLDHPSDIDDDVDHSFELAVSATASLAASAASSGRRVSIFTSQGEELPTDPSQLDATLERLAVIRPSPGHLPVRTRRSAAALIVSVALTGPHGSDHARRLTGNGGPVDAAVIVTCGGGRADRSRSAFHLTPEDLDDFARSWNALVGRTGRSS